MSLSGSIRTVAVVGMLALVAASGMHAPRTSARGRETKTPIPPPEPAASVDLGGTAGASLFGDVDGDGTPDAVSLRGGRIGAQTATGKVIYDDFVGATALLDVVDLDGDGAAEVLFIDAVHRRVAALDPRARRIRWQLLLPEGDVVSPSFVRIADINSSRPGAETVIFPDHSHSIDDATAYFVAADGEVYARPRIANINGNALNYPQLAIANIDGAGDPEVVVVGRPNLLVYDSEGRLASKLEFRSGDPEGRHYGTVTLANVDATPDLEAIVVADRISPVPAAKPQSINVFKLVPTVRELWRYVPELGEVFESVPHSVADFDGDGMADFAVNRYTGTTQAIEVYRGAGSPEKPGAPRLLCTVPDTFAWDMIDLDGDGTPELLTSHTKREKPSLSPDSELSVLRIDHSGGGCALVPVEPVLHEQYVTRPLRSTEVDGLAESQSIDRNGVVTIEQSGRTAFLTYAAEEGGREDLRLHSLVDGKLAVLAAVESPGNVRFVAPPALMLIAEKSSAGARADALAFYAWNASAKRLTRLGDLRTGSFDDAAPVAADLDGDGWDEIVTRLPGRRIAAFGFDRTHQQFTRLWQADGNSRPLVDAAAHRVFAVAPDARERAVLVAYDDRGRQLWRRRLAQLPARTRFELVLGQFTGGGPLDVWLSAPRDQSWMVDGSSGKVVWTSKAVAHFDNRVAVRDVNSDGTDDLIVVSNDVYGVYSGRDASPIVTPRDIRTLGADLFATPLPGNDGSLVLSARGALARATVAGKKVWSVRRTTQRTQDSLLPAIARDADGAPRFVGGNFGPLDRFVTYDYKNGRVKATSDLIPSTDVLAVDVDGDGVQEFVFGTGDGRLVAVRGETASEVWSVALGALPSTPVVAHLEGTHMDLVVPTEDGRLTLFTLVRPPARVAS